MSKQRAFVRYTKAGNIVPGSLILTNGSYPNGPGIWKEIGTDLCCEQNNNTMNYKVYTALLNQEGANPPVATILENTLGGTPVWTRVNKGIYHCTLAGAFPADKTVCFATVGGNSASYNARFSMFGNPDIVGLYFDSYTGPGYSPADIDNGYPDFNVEIRVYP